MAYSSVAPHLVLIPAAKHYGHQQRCTSAQWMQAELGKQQSEENFTSRVQVARARAWAEVINSVKLNPQHPTQPQQLFLIIRSAENLSQLARLLLAVSQTAWHPDPNLKYYQYHKSSTTE